MKLELKHVSGYLHYGLRGSKDSKSEEMYTLLSFNKNSLWWNLDSSDEWSLYVKPILRPLSDLTKEIEVNGEKFVPIEEYSHLRLEEISTFKGGCNAMKFIQARELELLYELHFDIHGLIEKGLAIDINTL